MYGSQDTRDCSVRLHRRCCIHPYNDINEWKRASTLVISSKYLLVLHLKSWALEVFLLVKMCIHGGLIWPLITPILLIKK